MMIILKALADLSDCEYDFCRDEIVDDYLINKRAKQDKMKLQTTKSDKNQFAALVDGKYDDLDQDCHMYRNYEFCRQFMEKMITEGISPEKILDSLKSLEIVVISLDKNEDDPQVIFESINSTGRDLTRADMIRNFLLMNCENQEELYAKYWIEIEKHLKHGNDYTNLNDFFFHYTAYRTRKETSERYLYDNFVSLFDDITSKNVSVSKHETMLSDLKYHSDIFKAFVNDDDKQFSNGIRKSLRALRQISQTTCHPFLLAVFHDFKEGIISEEVVEKILHLLVTYFVRRIVCEKPSNTLRILFVTLYHNIFRNDENRKKYYESINKYLHMSQSNRMPSNDEFKNALETVNIYRKNKVCRFLMMEIENGDKNERLDFENISIEHIMPQTLSPAWNHIDFGEHLKYVNKLGNISVTGNNSKMSNKGFAEKKKFYSESKAVELNKDVIDKEEWTIDDIIRRGERLSQIILERFSVDYVNDDCIIFEKAPENSQTVTLLDECVITNKDLVSYTFCGKTYPEKKYRRMLVGITKMLFRKNEEQARKMAQENYSATGRRTYLSSMADGLKEPEKIADGVFMETNFSAQNILQCVGALMQEFGVGKDQFSCVVVDKRRKQDVADIPDDED